MKKFIPILSLAVLSFAVQNCNNRDEDLARENYNSEKFSSKSQSKDSITTKQSIVDPDPPVRDGDNWRIDPKK